MGPTEAAAHFVARRGEGLTPSEQGLLEQWLEADPAHPRELARVERAWEWLSDASGHEVLDAMRAHAVAPRRREWVRYRPALAAAIVIALLAAMGILVRGLNVGAPSPGSERRTMIAYVSAPGQVKTFELPDGSRMTLDAGSKVLGRFEGAERLATLVRGRAFFEVKASPSRPFAVTAGDRRVVALGTRFDTALGGGALTVNLIEGRVTVGPVDKGAEPVALKAGQQFVEREGSAVIRTLGADIESEAGWTRGLLHFDDAPLARAIVEVNRYSAAQVVIRQPDVASMRISGEFRAGDALRFAETVAELRPVTVVRRGEEVELVRRE